jgi:serine/threonine protein kinase/flagellar motility protein MotE (MotC chaperone)
VTPGVHPSGDPEPGNPVSGEPRVLSGRYRLVYKLGGGGMGSVWLAEDTLLERSVALKELVQHAGTSNLPERRTRALQEARAMARVRHPAIVPIHDVFFIADDPWIVMEYISGRSLHDLIKDQSLDERAIARIGLHVLHGLIAVHRVGVLHRDVKPTNILVANDGSIFLVDFGIARIAGDASLTGQAIVGTLDFLAPERFKPRFKVGPAADIWALGVTFYYALEGYSPFWRDSDRGWEATMIAILKDAPRPLSKGGELADVTLRMLHKDPDRRADAHDVLSVLEHIVGSAPAPPSPSSRVQAPAPVPADQAETQDAPAQSDRISLVDPPPPERRDRTRQPVAEPVAQPIGRPPANQAGYRSGDGRRGLRFDDAREMIKNVGTDTGVAMLLAMSEDDAARILTDCPPRLAGALLQGIAAARPATAATILRLLRSGTAGRAFAYLRPETSASLVATMTQGDALRILDSTDERTVAGVIMELPVPTSAGLLMSMYSRQRAAQVLTHVRPVTAAELLSSDPAFAGAVLRYLSEPVRKQVSRHLVSVRARQPSSGQH